MQVEANVHRNNSTLCALQVEANVRRNNSTSGALQVETNVHRNNCTLGAVQVEANLSLECCNSVTNTQYDVAFSQLFSQHHEEKLDLEL